MADKVVVQSDPEVVGGIRQLDTTLQELTAAVQEGTRQTVEEVRGVAKSAAKTELAKQKAEVEVIGPLIERQEETIRKLSQKTSQRMAAIEKKFTDVDRELKRAYRRNVERLGAHIFEILLVEYQRGIEDRMRDAEFEVFTGLTQKVHERRIGSLRDQFARMKKAVDSFVDKRKLFASTLGDIKIESQPRDDPEFGVPFWIIETQDELGHKEVSIIPLGNLQPTTDGERRNDYGLRLQPLTDYSQVAEIVDNHVKEIVKELSWKESSAADRTAIAGAVAALPPSTVSNDLRRLVTQSLHERPLSVA